MCVSIRCKNTAKQIIGVLFGVPQISVKLNEISDEHKRMLKFYLDFWIKYSEVLLKGKFTAYNPECLYSLVKAENEDTSISVCYSKNIVDLTNDKSHNVIVNGTGEDYIFIHTDEEVNAKYKRYNCVGDIVEENNNLILSGDYRILTTPSDVLEFNIIK